jgi:iron-sulfur cluster assembly protein
MNVQVINVTDVARSKLKELYVKEVTERSISEDDKFAIRVGVTGGGCSGLSYKVDFDNIKERDTIQDYEGFRIAIDPKSSIYLKDVLLDFQDGLQGKGFVFNNPQAKNTCGCGESFSF